MISIATRRASLPVTAPQATIVLALSLAALALFGTTINHDTAWYLVATRAWQNGAALYADLNEVNPPLNFYLTLPALWFADALGLSDMNGQVCVLLALLLWALCGSGRVLREAGWSAQGRAAFLAALALALMLPTYHQAGQREHVMLLLAAPWFVAQVTLARPDHGRGSLLRAGVAAVGFCIKPHFVLLPVAMGLARLVQTRRLSSALTPPYLAMLGVGLAYVAAIALLHPIYLTEILPAARLTYADYAVNPLVVALRLNWGLLGAVAVLAVALARDRALPAGYATLLWMVAVSTGLYLCQWKGFPYQGMPAESLALLAALWGGAMARSPAARAAVTVALVSALALAVGRGPYRDATEGVLDPYLAGFDHPPRVLVLSTMLSHAYPLLLRTGSERVSRYPTLWTLPGVLNQQRALGCDGVAAPATCAALREERARVVANTLEDARRAPPDVIVLATRGAYLSDQSLPFDRVFTDDPGFQALLRAFDPPHRQGSYLIYRRARSG